jgi:hypothetical protein
MHIPAGTALHVLRIHPKLLPPDTNNVIELTDIKAPDDTERVWPSLSETSLVPINYANKNTHNSFFAQKVTVKKIGDSALEEVFLPLHANHYSGKALYVPIDPIDSSALSSFTFYIINACYFDQPPPILSQNDFTTLLWFDDYAIVKLLGESDRKRVPLKVGIRGNDITYAFHGGALLMPAFRHWNDLPECR